MTTLTAMSRYVTTTTGLGGYDMSSLPEGAVDYFNPAVIEQLLLRPLPPVRPLATAMPCSDSHSPNHPHTALGSVGT